MSSSTIILGKNTAFNTAKQVSDEKRFTGHITQTIKNIFDDGDILLHQHPPFFKAAADFMVTVVRHLLKCYPIDDSLLKHTNWIHFTSTFNHNFNCVEYFVGIFLILIVIDEDKLQSQFLNYLTLAKEDLPKTTFNTTKVEHCQLMSFGVF